jgi:hypothetical protein
MKALSIRQPWAWAIVAGYKPVENRSRRTTFRGPLLVHAGKREMPEDINFVIRVVAEQTGRSEGDIFREYSKHLMAGALGAIVGVATISDCVQEMDSDWFFGPYGFVLTDARAISPVPCKGALGFFEVPADLSDAILSPADIGGASTK